MSKTITRRGFVKGSALAGAGAAAMALGGCDDGGASVTNEDGSLKKILRFGQTNAQQGLDMQKSTNSLAATIADCVFDAPLRWTDDLELVPNLLTEVPVFEEDGLTLHCTLKENILCHDGSTLTANDVKFSFERMFKPETAALSTYMYDTILGAKEMLAGEATELEGFTVEDDTHFTITLASPQATFVSNLGISYAHIFPQAAVEAVEASGEQWGWGTNAVGTGKYKLVSNDDTTEVVMEKFAEYHDGEPALDEVHIIFYDDANTQMLAFKNGDIDWCDLDTTLLQQYQQDASVADQITMYDTLGLYLVNLNLRDDMGLTDPRVREALSIAINREELVETIMAGAGIPATGFLCPSTPGYNADAELPYDPERARELLAEAGAEGLTLSAKIRPNIYEKYMTVVQSYWNEVGVTLNMTVEDAGVWSSDWVEGTLQVTTTGWWPLYPDADNHMYTYFYSENAAKKSSFYANDEFDALVSEARQSQDAEERRALYEEAEYMLVHEDWATVPLYWPKKAFVAKSYVKNAKVGNLIYHMYDIDIDTEDESYNPA